MESMCINLPSLGGDIVAAALCGRAGAVRHFLRAWPGGARWWNGSYDMTPLHAAARSGHVEVCRVLLAARAEVDAETSKCCWVEIWVERRGSMVIHGDPW